MKEVPAETVSVPLADMKLAERQRQSQVDGEGDIQGEREVFNGYLELCIELQE